MKSILIPNFQISVYFDCINKVESLIDRAVEIGLSGIAITDHECLSSFVRAKKHEEKIRKTNPDFKVVLGNEIYLCESREIGQKYYHFILLAKNKDGYMALKKLSSIAWMNSYYDRRMERVVTRYDDLKEVLKEYPNSLIGTTACLGGELSTKVMELINAEACFNTAMAECMHNEIVTFMLFCKDLFGEDFYIECAPGKSREQIAVNKRLQSIAKAFDVKMVIGTDAHYLTKNDRYVHKAYLNSKGGEREVDAFYEFSYLQTEDEIIENLIPSFEDAAAAYQTLCKNSIEIFNKIEDYSIFHKQVIPSVELPFDYPKTEIEELNDYPTLKNLFNSDDAVERYWANQCWTALEEKIGPWQDNLNYVARLEEEASVKKIIGEKLETNMFSYPVTLQHYVDLFWKCGSIVGAGRGSSCSGLNHYLLGITQLDPIQWDLPFWRYLNPERTELGDIDIDLDPSRRPAILKAIKAERGAKFKDSLSDIDKQNLGCTLIATFGTETSKSAIQTACRGYRSEDFPDGIDVDIAQYLSSLVPVERGFVWSISDVMFGNSEKDRKPVTSFINEVAKYPGLSDILFAIEGLIKQRGSHASGVIFFDEDPYEFGCFMKTPSGDICTQFDLHDAEAVGMTKYDLLVTSVQTKISQTIALLQEYGLLDKNLTLKEVYDTYLHPNVLPLDDADVWKAIEEGSVLNIFQFDSDVGAQAAKKIKPHTIRELSDSNGLMRLMTAEKGAETPMEKYVRFKNDIKLWYEEMNEFGLTEEEQKILEPYFLSSYGVPPSQEQMMKMLMDENICNFSLGEANNARKIVGKFFAV